MFQGIYYVNKTYCFLSYKTRRNLSFVTGSIGFNTYFVVSNEVFSKLYISFIVLLVLFNNTRSCNFVFLFDDILAMYYILYFNCSFSSSQTFSHSTNFRQILITTLIVSFKHTYTTLFIKIRILSISIILN